MNPFTQCKIKRKPWLRDHISIFSLRIYNHCWWWTGGALCCVSLLHRLQCDSCLDLQPRLVKIRMYSWIHLLAWSSPAVSGSTQFLQNNKKSYYSNEVVVCSLMQTLIRFVVYRTKNTCYACEVAVMSLLLCWCWCFDLKNFLKSPSSCNFGHSK